MSLIRAGGQLSFLTISFQMYVAYKLRPIYVQYFRNIYIPLFLAPQEKRQESRLKLKKNASMKTDVNRI